MCGIAGWFGLPPDVGHLDAMVSTLERRGPDDAGWFSDQEVTLGMRRLAVIDLGGGAQPRIDRASGVALVYNGELYNYRELSRELEARGHQISGHSDSEVLLRAWLEWGEGCLERLNGMFAFALWEPSRRRLLLARDHLGQKPLHYWWRNGALVFGSELRTVLAHPQVPRSFDPRALADYLRLRHVPGPETLIAEVRQLPPGSLLEVSAECGLALRRYWRPTLRPDPRIDLPGAVEEFERLWRPAVRRHLVSEVPLGAFLSGGIDSALVAAEAAGAVEGFRTFSIAFDEPGFDETPYALDAAKALGCRHEVFRFDASLATLLDEWVAAYDQPFADPAAFPLLVLAREARARVTVALTGDGGDELFAGYQRYRSTLWGRRLLRLPAPLRRLATQLFRGCAGVLPADLPARYWLDAASRRIALIEEDVSVEYLRQFQTWSDPQLATLLPEVPASRQERLAPGDLLGAMLCHDLDHWLPDQMLVKVDRACMAHSLEARLPFLDREIVEFALRLPLALQLAGGVSKRILREVAVRRLPPSLATRPKHGFAVPVDRWLRDEPALVEEILEQGLRQTAFPLHGGAVRALWREHRDAQYNHGERLLALLILLVWEQALRDPP